MRKRLNLSLYIKSYLTRLFDIPLLVPTIYIVLSSRLTYIFYGSFLSAAVVVVLISFLLLFVCSTYVSLPEKRLKSIIIVFTGVLLSVFSMSVISNAFEAYYEIKSYEGRGFYDVLITDTEYKADGTYKLTGIYEGVRVYLESDIPIYSGETVTLSGNLYEPNEPTNPGQFDYKEFLHQKGMFYVIKVDSISEIKTKFFPSVIISKFKCFIKKSVINLYIDSSYLRDEDKSMITALCLGDTVLIDDETERNFRLSSCSHLLAVSGTHFSSFILFSDKLIDMFGFSDKFKKIVKILFAMLIGFVTGWHESVTRAFIMYCCLAFDYEFYSSFCLGMIINSIQDPFVPNSTGFQMSYLSVFGIRLICSIFTYEKCNISNFVRQNILPASGALIGLLIVLSDVGYKLHPVCFVVQIISSFFCQVICMFFLPGVFLSSILSLFVTDLGFLFIPCSLFTRLISKLTSFSAYYSFDGLDIKILGHLSITLAFLLIVSVLLPKSLIKKFLKVPSIILLMFSLVFDVLTLDRSFAQMYFLDVGQGDCCLVQYDDVSFMVDGGTEDNGLYVLPDTLDYLNIRKLDFAIVTHWDRDHCGGIIELLKANRIGYIYSPFIDVNYIVDKFPDLFNNAEIIGVLRDSLIEIKEGFRLSLSDNFSIEVISPYYSDFSENDSSAVIYMNVYDTIVLLTGDAGFETEERLLTDGKLYDTDILKVAHHGSRFSTSYDFLRTIIPEDSVISVGEYNNYGHPSDVVLKNLNDISSNIYQTSKNGAITVRFYEYNYSIECMNGGPA